tara:strand:- start:511 stop:672 length:162 start_codon:yes stop_codon:yes gene_type:complete
MNQNKLKEWAEEQIELHNAVINNTSTEKFVGIVAMGYIRAMEDFLMKVKEEAE